MQSVQPGSRGLLEDPRQKPTWQLGVMPALTSLPCLLAVGWGATARLTPPKLHLMKHLEVALQHQERMCGVMNETLGCSIGQGCEAETVLCGYWLLCAEQKTLWLLESGVKSRECLWLQDATGISLTRLHVSPEVPPSAWLAHLRPAPHRDEHFQTARSEQVKAVLEGE
ncbi:unnamed protein product [Rangifer tarandus platyrhynchus]|uniref:Uncharacterized protein n=2 Tax=Rangifer tarandus platyrhynchus TaxID=3082113 RepID=A0ACB0EEA2_RANTA|nr:unnamed protein product [Rangifer tarandus platyrhynchus]CAI9698803.1 unnamed protein product [Rangifer tarandus platyrhynchus]